MIPCYLFRMASQCWLCSARLATKKDLRAHIGSSSHLQLRVLCPWCFDKEYTSNRMGDLKKHASTKHGAEHLVSSGFFGDAIGFYLAMYPQDYARVITPSAPTTKEAIEAMGYVRRWVGAAVSSSRSLQDWERGWTLGDATPTREEPSSFQPLRPARGDVPPPYSPTRPELVADLNLNQIYVMEDVVQLDAVQGNSYDIVNLNGSVKRDVSRMATLQRSIVNTRARPAGIFAEVKGTLYQEQSNKISQLTQVSEIYIDNIQSITPEPGRLPHPFPLARAPTSAATTPPPPPPPVRRAAVPSSSAPIQPPPPATLPQPPANLPPPSLIPGPRNPSQQACDLLSWGVMPLIPPARRNWDQDEVVTLKGRQTTLKWPPRGWRSFTADRKLQVTEHASALLDSDASGFPVSSKQDIKDRYNFLALPGSAPRQKTPKSGMRHGNYHQLKDIALEKDNDFRVLKMFSKAAKERETELDSMIRQINQARVRLRLEK